MLGDDSLIIDGWLHACSLLALQQVQGSFRNTGSQGWSHGWRPGWEDKGTHLADENISAQLVKTTVRAKWQVNVQQGGWEVSEEERGTVGWSVGWGGEVTEWVPLLLAWPLVLRVGEALRVSLPGGRNSLRKAKRGEGHSRGLGWGAREQLCPANSPSLLPSPRPPSSWCQHPNLPHETGGHLSLRTSKQAKINNQKREKRRKNL